MFFSEKLPNIYVQLEPNAIYNNEDYLLENQKYTDIYVNLSNSV